MEKVVKQTKFYGTPDEGIAVLTRANQDGGGRLKGKKVARARDQSRSLFCFVRESAGTALRFDASYIEKDYTFLRLFHWRGVSILHGAFLACRLDRYHQRKKGRTWPDRKKNGLDIQFVISILGQVRDDQCDAVCITTKDSSTITRASGGWSGDLDQFWSGRLYCHLRHQDG